MSLLTKATGRQWLLYHYRKAKLEGCELTFENWLREVNDDE